MILIDELTLTVLITGYIWMIAPIAVVFWKTPAWAYIKAILGGKMMIPTFGEDKILRFIPVKKTMGGLAEAQFGFYNVNPNDIYFESKSKVPMALAFSNFAYSLNPKMAELIRKLKNHGVRNYEDLENLYKQHQKKKQDLEISVGEEEDEEKPKLSEIVRLFRGGMKDVKHLFQPILGHTINLSDLVYYFRANDRSDLIESEIQRRNIATLKRSGADSLKWLILVGIFILIVAVAVYILSMITPQTATDPNVIGNAVADAINRKVVTGTQMG